VLLAGHSMGAMLALALAHEQRERVAGLFLVDPVYADAGHRPAALKPLLQAICWMFEPLIASYQRDGWVSRAMTRQIFRSSFHDQAAMARAWEHQRRVVPMEYPRMFRESILGVAGFPFLPYADLVTVPVCLVEARHRAGARSRYARVVARFQAQSQSQARAGVRCEHVVIDGGHYLQLDRPQAVTQALVDFVGSLRG
jgi:pimeloyl-ACP methyl ester carboxylesterase